ncbi:MAG: hypothetical protein ACI8PZ_003458 [Myxococcota bacterium]|jgi:hypothetical protein
MIAVVGLGIVDVDHLTRQAEAVLRSVRVVLVRDRGLATTALLEGLCPQVVCLERHVSDDEVAARTVDAALTHGSAALAVRGHPTFGEPATARLHDLCAVLGVPLQLVAGVSALDAVAATVLHDPLAAGLQVFDATDLVNRSRHLHADVPLWVFGLGALVSPDRAPATAEAFGPLRDHLLRFWPPSHPCIAAHAASHPLATPAVQTVALGELCAWGPTLHPDVSLLLPAVSR